MSKLVVITNLNLLKGELRTRIYNFCLQEAMIVLRMKEVSENDYKACSLEILKDCKEYKEKIYLHNFIKVALELEHKNIWLPLKVLRENTKYLCEFNKIVASIHSVDEAKEALDFGANILCVSHIFETECKKDILPKGINLIKDIRKNFSGEIYALGGINFENYKECLNAGANMVCSMRGSMMCENEKEFTNRFV